MGGNLGSAVSVRNISKRYPKVNALTHVDFEIHQGESVGLLGTNGAGKTTLLKTITGVLRPTSGEISVFGEPPSSNQARVRIGATPQDDAIPKALNVREVLTYAAKHFPNPRAVEDIIESFGLFELTRRPVAKLSGGQRRRVAIGLAFIGRPDLILLDEPTAGLDVDAREEILFLIQKEINAGVTAIVTSHYLEDIEALAKRLIVLAKGQKILDGGLGDVLSKKANSVMTFQSPTPEKVSLLVGQAGTVEHLEGNRIKVRSSQTDSILKGLVEHHIDFSGMDIRQANLSEYYLNLVRGHGADTSDQEAKVPSSSRGNP